MPFYERGPVRIHYEEAGSGFPLLLIPGGGLNSALASWQTASPFNPMERYKKDFRCICADLRNANPGQSSGPLEIDRPWDAYTDDQLGLITRTTSRAGGRRCARSAQTSPWTWSMTSSPACTRTAPTSSSPCRAISYAPSGHRC